MFSEKQKKRIFLFLIETIVAAEKSGTDVFSYSKIFELPESEIRKILADILAEDATGQELCYSDYLMAEYEEESCRSRCRMDRR
ncbi:MAG: hypothetical protein IPG90_15760 [Bacteroidetes bacterium]|nr:hypothetical protein [Bacteroidota bacterium]